MVENVDDWIASFGGKSSLQVCRTEAKHEQHGEAHGTVQGRTKDHGAWKNLRGVFNFFR